MAGGFKMAFVADVAPFLRGTKDVEGALEKVSGSLDDLARDATSSGGKAADALTDVGDAAKDSARDLEDLGDGAKSAAREVDTQAEKAGKSVEDIGDSAKDTGKVVEAETERMGRSFKDVLTDVKEQGRTTFKTMGDDVKDGADKASEGFDEMKDEANSTAREAAASFSGDPVDALDALQEVAANALAGFGPLGAAAGLALALGIGVAVTKMQEVAEEADAAKENVGELANEIHDAGGDIADLDLGAKLREWAAELKQNDNWLTFWKDESTSNLDAVRKAIATTGEDFTEFLQGFASGDIDAASNALNAYRKQVESLSAEIDEQNQIVAEHTTYMGDGAPVMDEVGTAAANLAAKLRIERDSLRDTTDELQGQIDPLKEAQENSDFLAAAAAGVTVEQIKLRRAVDDANDALDEAGSKARDAATAQLDLEDQIAETTKAMTETDDKTGELLSTENERKRTLIDLAAQIVNTAETTDDYNGTIAKNRQAFIDAAGQMGITGQAAEDLADKYGLIPKIIETDVNAQDKATEVINRVRGGLDSLKDKTVTVRVDSIMGDFLGATNQIPASIARPGIGRAQGGIVPGQPSTMDNQYIHAAAGEYVVNAQATAKHRELLDAINQGRTPAGAAGGAAPVINMTVNAAPGMSAEQVAEIAATKITEALASEMRGQRGGRYTRGRGW